MGGVLKKLVNVGATAAGTAVGGPVGGAIGAGLAGFGDSIAHGNGVGSSLVAGTMSGLGQGLQSKAPGVDLSLAPPDITPHFAGIPSASDLSIDSSLAPAPSLLDVLQSRKRY